MVLDSTGSTCNGGGKGGNMSMDSSLITPPSLLLPHLCVQSHPRILPSSTSPPPSEIKSSPRRRNPIRHLSLHLRNSIEQIIHNLRPLLPTRILNRLHL